jgi:hypothetical protein
MKGILSSALKIGESAGSTALRTLNAQLFPKSATKVRQGQAVNDIIGLNAKTPNRYAKPPFPSRKGSPFPRLTGDPRAAVTGAARREELIQKIQQRRALAKKKSPVKGSVTKSVKTPIEGPKTKDVSNVDDLFGDGRAPMGYKYGSRK